MPKHLYPESMIGEARKAERIAASESGPTARHTCYGVAHTWRALAEHAWEDLARRPCARHTRERCTMADLSKVESLIENAGEAEQIAASEIDAEAKQRWLEIAASWRVMAERELVDALGEATTLQ